jgi:hypothetical protein
MLDATHPVVALILSIYISICHKIYPKDKKNTLLFCITRTALNATEIHIIEVICLFDGP